MSRDESADSPSRFLRRREQISDFGEVDIGDTFLVMVEGKVTERHYFEGIRRCLSLGSMHVRVVSPGHQDPVGLIEEAMAERAGPKRRRTEGRASIRDPETYDHVWTVFDTDASAQDGTLKKALELAKREKIRVAFSTPSFEFWLLLHFRFTTGPLLDSAAAERALSEAWRTKYEKTPGTFAKLWPALKSNLRNAVAYAARVREHHEQTSRTFPPNPGTQVDLLVHALNASVQPPLRILR